VDLVLDHNHPHDRILNTGGLRNACIIQGLRQPLTPHVESETLQRAAEVAMQKQHQKALQGKNAKQPAKPARVTQARKSKGKDPHGEI